MSKALMGEELDNVLKEDLDDGEGVLTANKKQHVEISCPMFLRPIMKKILTLGKTIKIIRYLENNEMMKAGDIEQQGINYLQLQRENARIVGAITQRLAEDKSFDYQAISREMPS